MFLSPKLGYSVQPNPFFKPKKVATIILTLSSKFTAKDNYTTCEIGF